MVEKFDVVVVGAGPAGVASAIVTARAGMNVLLIERGDFAGSKNMFGGIVFRRVIEDLVGPNWWVTPPGQPPQVERHIIEYQYWFLSRDAHLAIRHRNMKFDQDYNSFSALRARFDKWFAKKAEEAGATLVTKTTAIEVLKQNGKVTGVKTDRGDVHADVVVAADGANSLLAKNAGLHPEIPPDKMAIAVKETLALPRDKIDERFNLRGDQGVAMTLLGPPMFGMSAGFLYTNKDTISFGFGVVMKDLVEGKNYKEHRALPNTILEQLKKHPSIKPLLEGAATREYTAHMIPEGGYDSVPPLYTDRMVVVGDAAMLVNVINWEGTNLAMTSGKLAGQAIVEAKKAGSFSAANLSRYRYYLEQSYVLRDLKKYRNVPTFFGANKQFFDVYPEALNQAAYLWHLVDGEPKEKHVKEIKSEIWKRRSKIGMAKDLYGLWRNLL